MNTNSPRPRNDQAMSTEDFYRELFAKAQAGTLEELAAPPRPALPRPVNPANPEAISTEEFYRQIFAQARQAKAERRAGIQPQAPAAPTPTVPRVAPDEPQSLEDFYRELFAKPEKPLVLGPHAGLTPPALPARFSRVRGGNQLVSYELLVGEDGRIAAKHENVAGSESYFIYEYDATGHLLRAWRDGRLTEEYAYDGRGARVASWNARDGQWAYAYDRGRLASAGPWRFAYADDGSLREAWTPKYSFRLPGNQGGQPRTVLPGGRVLRSETIAPGLPTERYINAVPVESLTWRSPLQLAAYRDRQRGVQMQFHYAQGRLPLAVTVQDASGTTTYLLGYDQVGSLKAAAAMDGPNEGRVVKVVDYDAFGNVLADSNPALFMPIAFAGGLRDKFTGLVRFCHRDYDPTVGRFTAPDPLGDTGGDHDLYDYCVDEPVGRVDPGGLAEEGVQWAEEVQRQMAIAETGEDMRLKNKTSDRGEAIADAAEMMRLNDKGRDVVLVAQRDAQTGNPLVDLFDHKWIKVGDYAPGMGPDTGEVPGRGPKDGLGTPTRVVDHSKEVDGVKYTWIKGVDAKCVRKELPLGKPTGPWIPSVNDCHGLVQDTLDKCRKPSEDKANDPTQGWY